MTDEGQGDAGGSAGDATDARSASRADTAPTDRAALDPAALDRYARQIVLEEVGAGGQARLGDAAVLVVGAGGLGAPAIQYLAGAGVGTLGVADGDAVERANLHRQPVHGTDDVGEPKPDSVRAFVADLNPAVDLRTHDAVTPGTARERVAEYDLVLDCTDTFRARYLLNDACVLEGVPLVGGAVHRFEGQLVAVDGAPCYRCVFPEAPAPGTVPSCAEAGVLGPVPGVVGSMQAVVALRKLLGVGAFPTGELRVYDALGGEFERVPFDANPSCPVCGDEPIDSLSGVDYEGRCAVGD